jgi:nucleotide-binding universal stress UspA family protein
MPRRVLIPLDGSDKAAAAIAALPTLASPDDEIVLLSVAEPEKALQRGIRPGRIVWGEVGGPSCGIGATARPDMPVYGETTDQTFQRQLNETMNQLRLIASKLEGQGFKVMTAAEINEDPADAIADVARRTKPVFILMKRTTHPGIGQRLFGTVAQQVIRANVAPVLILPDDG